MKYILLILMLLIAPVAGLEIYSYPSETSIKWNYSEFLPIVNMSFDGKEITGVNTQFGEYVSSNLHENETHFFTIYADGLYHTKQETTLSSTTEQEKTFGFINSYIFLIIVLLALVVSAWVQLAAF